MKTRILSFGTNTLPDYELLESLLFYSIPRRDTKPIAKALLAKFKISMPFVRPPRRNYLKLIILVNIVWFYSRLFI